MPYQSFEELEVWKRSCRLAVLTCQVVVDSRLWALRDQMQRSCISVPSNIAEGCERDGRLDFIRFLRIAKGSAAELRTQIYIAQKLKMVGSDEADLMVAETKEIAAMIQGLIRSLARRS